MINAPILRFYTQSQCEKIKAMMCNGTNWRQMGITVKRCVFKCCTEEKCNGLNDDDQGGKGSNGGTFNIAPFPTAFVNMMAIFVGYFIDF